MIILNKVLMKLQINNVTNALFGTA